MADIKQCGIAEAHQRHHWTEAWPEDDSRNDSPLKAFFHGCPGVGFPDSMEDLENAMAKVIWEASRADEGSISATGANIVARSLINAGFGVPGPAWPRLVVNGVEQDPADPQAWKLGSTRIMEIPEQPPHPLLEVLERIAEAIENNGVDNEVIRGIEGSLDAIERRGR